MIVLQVGIAAQDTSHDDARPHRHREPALTHARLLPVHQREARRLSLLFYSQRSVVVVVVDDDDMMMMR